MKMPKRLVLIMMKRMTAVITVDMTSAVDVLEPRSLLPTTWRRVNVCGVEEEEEVVARVAKAEAAAVAAVGRP